jgi:hypothetical protein
MPASPARRDQAFRWLASLDSLRELLIFERLSELRSVLNQALSRFSLGLRELSDRNPSIYGVAFLQLYDHMLERVPALLCASEICGNRFAHQRGRAVHEVLPQPGGEVLLNELRSRPGLSGAATASAGVAAESQTNLGSDKAVPRLRAEQRQNRGL